MMPKKKVETRVGISTQTSVGDVTATTGGHGEGEPSLRVASCQKVRPPTATGAGCSSGNATAQGRYPKGSDRQNRSGAAPGAEVATDSDQESARSLNTMEEEELLRSPPQEKDAGLPRTTRSRPSREGRKALKEYKAAVKIVEELGLVKTLTEQQQEKLAWAKSAVAKGREHFASRRRFAAENPAFTNKVEEGIIKRLAVKRQRSTEEVNPSALKKPKQGITGSGNGKKGEPKPTTSRRALASEVAKRHLIVALIDRSNPLGQMSLERWKQVEMRLLDALCSYMETNPERPMPSFDGAGWLNGVKIVKCNDELTLDWCKRTVQSLQGLWEGAKLEVVDRDNIPSIPKAKVTIPRVVPAETALKLLQRQNPGIPTADWKVLKVEKPTTTDGGQNFVLQINKEAEDLLYPKFGKMAWGLGSVYLRLKKRHPRDANTNTLEAGEVESDLGLQTLAEVASKPNLEGGCGSSGTSQPLTTHLELSAPQDAKGSTSEPPPQ